MLFSDLFLQQSVFTQRNTTSNWMFFLLSGISVQSKRHSAQKAWRWCSFRDAATSVNFLNLPVWMHLIFVSTWLLFTVCVSSEVVWDVKRPTLTDEWLNARTDLFCFKEAASHSFYSVGSSRLCWWKHWHLSLWLSVVPCCFFFT